MKSRRVDEWMLDDLDDFEFVRSGGLPVFCVCAHHDAYGSVLAVSIEYS